MNLMISYEINPSSCRVAVDRILDIRPAAFDENGSYKLPDEMKRRHFVRQIGIVPRGGKAYVYIQPRGIYSPDFGYGPITGRISIRKGQVELPGDYDEIRGTHVPLMIPSYCVRRAPSAGFP